MQLITLRVVTEICPPPADDNGADNQIRTHVVARWADDPTPIMCPTDLIIYKGATYPLPKSRADWEMLERVAIVAKARCLAILLGMTDPIRIHDRLVEDGTHGRYIVHRFCECGGMADFVHVDEAD